MNVLEPMPTSLMTALRYTLRRLEAAFNGEGDSDWPILHATPAESPIRLLDHTTTMSMSPHTLNLRSLLLQVLGADPVGNVRCTAILEHVTVFSGDFVYVRERLKTYTENAAEMEPRELHCVLVMKFERTSASWQILLLDLIRSSPLLGGRSLIEQP